MATLVMNCVISPFEGNINPVDPTGLKLHLQAIKEIDKKAYKLDISVSIPKKLKIIISV